MPASVISSRAGGLPYYDGNKVIEKSGAEAVIPQQKNRNVQREYDQHLDP